MAEEHAHSSQDLQDLSDEISELVPPDPRGMAIHANSNSYYCITCGDTTKRSCKQCKKAHYCSSACQWIDWETHKLICKSLSELKRPAGKFSLILFFPVDKDKPQWIWLPTEETEDYDDTALPVYCPSIIGIMKQLGADTAPVDCFTLNRCPVPKERDPLRSVAIWRWDYAQAVRERQPMNKSLQSIEAEEKLLVHGPLLLAVYKEFEPNLVDGRVPDQVAANVRPDAADVTAADFSYFVRYARHNFQARSRSVRQFDINDLSTW